MPAPCVQRSHHSLIKLYDLWLLPCPCIVKCRMTNKICIRDLTSKEKKPLFCQRIQCVHHCQTWRHSIAAFDLWAGQHCSGIPTGSQNSRPVLFTSRPSQSIQVASSTSMMAKNSKATSVTSTSILVLLLSCQVSSNPLSSNIFFPDTVKRYIKWGNSFLNAIKNQVVCLTTTATPQDFNLADPNNCRIFWQCRWPIMAMTLSLCSCFCICICMMWWRTEFPLVDLTHSVEGVE